MALSDITDLGLYPPLVRRITGAAVKAAVAVGAETYDGSQYSIMRRALATNVLHDADLWGERFARAVPTNAEITAGSSDADLEFTVNSMWDAMAGAFVVP